MLNEKADRCTATTRDGERCKNPAVRGSSVCRMHGASGGAPEGNENAVTHGGYAKPDAAPRTRQAYMLKHENKINEELGAAREEGDEERARRLFRLYIKSQRLQTREARRIRRAISAVVGGP